MRPLAAIVTSAVILGGLQLYMVLRERYRPPAPTFVERFTEDAYGMELTLTFRAARDAFEFDDEGPVLSVLFRGDIVFAADDAVDANVPVVVDNIPGIVVGANEFVVHALTGGTDWDTSHAVRIRLLRNGLPIAEQTLWSDPGEPVRGTVFLDVPEALREDEHEDDHEHENVS